MTQQFIIKIAATILIFLNSNKFIDRVATLLGKFEEKKKNRNFNISYQTSGKAREFHKYSSCSRNCKLCAVRGEIVPSSFFFFFLESLSKLYSLKFPLPTHTNAKS